VLADKIHVDGKAAWGGSAAKRLGINWDEAVIWRGMPVRTQGGRALGYVRDAVIDEDDGSLNGLGLTSGMAADVAVGTTDMPAKLVKGWDGSAIVVEEEATAIESDGGAAVAAGKAAAVAQDRANKSAAAGSNEQKVGDYYASCMDTEQIEGAGTESLLPEFDRISKIQNLAGLEAEIARQMGISRGPIREAVRQLEQEELVEYHPRRGVVVASLTWEAVQDTYAVRAQLDGFAARLAVAKITDDHLSTLDDLISTMRQQAQEGNNENLLNADVEFHRCIYLVTGNKVLLRAWTSLGPHSWTLFSGLQLRGYSLRDIAERHREIVDALRTRDPVAAEHAAREHTLEIARNVLDHLGDTELDLANGAPHTIHLDR